MLFDLELFLATFVTLFVVIDSPGVAPVFASLVQGSPKGYATRMALRATMIAAGILLAFAFGGKWLLTKMGVSLDAFRVAGGALLFLIAVDMVFEKRTSRREERAEEVKAHEKTIGSFEDISVFPMAIPMLAGPGSIAAVMLAMGEQITSPSGQITIVAALLLNLALALVILLGAVRLIGFMGVSVASMITRVFGVILAALAAQFVLDGVKAFMGVS
jgi:multiple antibiotic resistance protein